MSAISPTPPRAPAPSPGGRKRPRWAVMDLPLLEALGSPPGGLAPAASAPGWRQARAALRS
eukprot:6767423-Alexandrium_andersonii.AAC.1